MNKYLVTGGEGFIGSKIVKARAGKSFDIKSGLDILDTPFLDKEMADTAGIFHCAAKVSVPESFAIPEEYHRTNVEGTSSVIKAAEKHGLKIVFSSSTAVYGESTTKVNESLMLFPKSPYAKNKEANEEMLKKSKIPHIALRYFNVYGPGQSTKDTGVITSFITSALRGENIIIYGNGSQIRDFVFIDDVVTANIAAMEYKNSSFEVFNIASGKSISVRELTEIILSLTKSSSKIVYQPPRAGDTLYSQADISKAERLLNWKPTIFLEEGLRKTIEYYR